jgi:preprotein translocase SecF subunit
MYNIVEKRRYYYLFSGVLLLLGLATLVYSFATTGQFFRLSIDFTGGTLFELQFEEGVGEQQIRDLFAENGFQDIVVQELVPLATDEIDAEAFPAGSRWSVRTEEAEDETINTLLTALDEQLVPLDREATSTSEVSGAVGSEVSRAAVFATIATTFVIMGFMWAAFRNVPHAFRYGASAIIAMFHDILLVIGFMSIMGLILGWEADALFLTALLTVLGYSVQDTIVMFDRVRENIVRRRGESFELIVNRSILETIHRSLATQLNAIFVMIALVLFGGETIREFIIILLVGLAAGTYSSIFIAVPLLVSWEKGEIPFINQQAAEDAPVARASSI